MAPFNPNLIRITEKEKSKIRQNFEIDDEERLKDALTSLVDWCSKQEHFVENNINKNILERCLILSNGSVEKSKAMIDRMLTIRGMMEDLVLRRSPQEFAIVCQQVTCIPLPKLNPSDLTRAIMWHILIDNLAEFDNMLTIHRHSLLIIEYLSQFDYALAQRHVYDLRNVNLSLLSKLNLVVLKKIEVLAMKAYRMKIKGIHFLNAPPFVDKLVFLLKQILKEKLAQRIYVHSTYEDFHKHISKEVLPSDYGGEDQSVGKLHEQWTQELGSPAMAEFCEASEKLVTDESKRANHEAFNEEYLGIPGSFRKLNVD